jgi:hypothetical protein
MARDIGKPIFDLFLVVASAVGFYMATTLPAVSLAGGLSPASFPKLISGLIFVCAVPCLFRDAYEWLSTERERDKESIIKRWDLKRGELQWLIVVALIIFYIIIFEWVGYIASTAIFCFLNVFCLFVASGDFSKTSTRHRMKRLVEYSVFSIVLSVVIYFVFTQLFNIPLPD